MSKQRPWGWIVWRAMAEPEIERCKPKDGDYVLCEPLYTVPPARKPLTDEEILNLWEDRRYHCEGEDFIKLVRWIERWYRQ